MLVVENCTASLQILAVMESKVEPVSALLNVYMLTSDGSTLTTMYAGVTLGSQGDPSGVAPGGSYAGRVKRFNDTNEVPPE